MKPIVPAGRVVGLDAARALALLGMMATHILVGVDADGVTLPQQIAGGRASALFAVLAGVSLALMTGGTTPPRGRRRGVLSAGLAVRALLVALVGLLLGEVDSGIAVILTYYGLLFLLGLPFLGLRTRPLVVLAGGWLLVVPVLSHLLRPHLPPPSYASPSFASLADPAQLLGELAFTGYYPAVPWLAYLLAGLAVGRLDLRRSGTAGTLVVWGAVLAVVSALVSRALLDRPGVMGTLGETFTGPGLQATMATTLEHGLYGTTPTGSWWWLAVRAPHTATPFDLAHSIGSALVVIGICLVAGRLLPTVLAVALGAGAMTLTLYTAHVALRAPGLWDGDDTETYLAQAAVALAVGALYRLGRRRGPLEEVLARASGGTQRALTPQPSVRTRA
jgi:hypothetical protein